MIDLQRLSDNFCLCLAVPTTVFGSFYNLLAQSHWDITFTHRACKAVVSERSWPRAWSKIAAWARRRTISSYCSKSSFWRCCSTAVNSRPPCNSPNIANSACSWLPICPRANDHKAASDNCSIAFSSTCKTRGKSASTAIMAGKKRLKVAWANSSTLCRFNCACLRNCRYKLSGISKVMVVILISV